MKCRRSLAPGCDALPPRARADVRAVVVHRIEVSQEDPAFADTAEEIARFFREHPIGRKATGGGMPYPIIVDPEGGVTQTVPLGRVTPHARAYNPTSIGVAAIGDFRARPPARPQRTALVTLCAALLREFDLGIEALHGHDELAGGSSVPDKECPGRHLSLVELRRDVALALPLFAGVELEW